MKVIVCIAEDGGMLFNNRRISRDKAVIKDIEESLNDSTLFISEFSQKLFKDSTLSVIAVTDPMISAKKGDAAFIENMHLSPYIEKINTITIYKWCDKYPSDFKLDISPEKEGMRLKESVEFVGNAHEKITKETWVK